MTARMTTSTQEQLEPVSVLGQLPIQFPVADHRIVM